MTGKALLTWSQGELKQLLSKARRKHQRSKAQARAGPFVKATYIEHGKSRWKVLLLAFAGVSDASAPARGQAGKRITTWRRDGGCAAER